MAKTNTKKIFAAFMVATMLVGMSTGACANKLDASPANAEVISTFVGDDGFIYEYLKYSEPVAYEYDGTSHTVLGKIRQKPNTDAIPFSYYREWTEYEIIDYGITDKWYYKSNPYFVTSVAKGEIVSSTYEQEVLVGVKAGIGIPSASQPALNQAMEGTFELINSNTYRTSLTYTFSGPDESSKNNTRSYYFYKGYHEHNITVVEQLYSNGDGLIREREYDNCYGYEPAAERHFEDNIV